MAYTQNDVINTDHINTVEVKIASPVADKRQWLNTVAGVVGTIATTAAALQGTLSGFAWFAPALAGISFLNQIFSMVRNHGVVSKNVLPTEVK